MMTDQYACIVCPDVTVALNVEVEAAQQFVSRKHCEIIHGGLIPCSPAKYERRDKIEQALGDLGVHIGSIEIDWGSQRVVGIAYRIEPAVLTVRELIGLLHDDVVGGRR
jgi:hypothetical protein